MRIPSARWWIPLFAGFALWPAIGLASEDDEVVEGPVLPPTQGQQQRRVVLRAGPIGVDFDRQFFQAGGEARSAEQHLQMQIRLQISELDQTCQLSEAQKAKLELAARGDLHRFLEPVDVLRKKFNDARQDPNAINQLWQEMRPLQTRMFRGLTGHGSLLMKTVPQTLTSEQAAKYEAVTAQRRLLRYRASVGVALHNIEATVALTHEQRETLTRLLVALPAPHAFGQYDYYLVMFRLAHMPADKLQPLFDERQWKALKKQFDRYGGMRSLLIEQGLLSPEDLGEVAVANPQREGQP